jgi:rubrerythrin
MANWTPDTVDWSRFDAARVSPALLAIAKAAALVENNGRDYARYLAGVFADDPEFQAAAARWAVEEVRHGAALARWAMLADPRWDFAAAAARFTAGYRVDIDATRSVRGSRTGELIARCIVETGTSSYYGAIADAAEEPVLAEICRRIAADEFRHYKLFYDHMRRYQTRERLGRLGRLRVGLGRLIEAGDDELAYAFFAANAPADAIYDRRTWSRAYERLAYALYRPGHVARGVAMAMKAVGLPSNGRLHAVIWQLAARALTWRARRLSARTA